jgi:alpha-tubulin suppressor-like RCC1 family protein
MGLPEVEEITAGGAHTCARTADGEVFCWGDNTQGQLGDGTRVRSPVPLLLRGLGGAAAVRAGGTLTCVLLDAGTVSCWGGAPLAAADAAPAGSLEPQGVPDVEEGTAIAVGRANACAVVAGGAVKCWTPDATEASPVAEITDAVVIEAGDDHTCALLTNGAVWCWGEGARGQLGRGQTPGAPGGGSAPGPAVW